MLEIIQSDIKSFTMKLEDIERKIDHKNLKSLETKLAEVELRNEKLEDENVNLKEKLLEMEY